tara:strand:+ start:45550 stop:45777 length:228 start_codon:yes stop_codon:yes gene_type:complete
MKKPVTVKNMISDMDYCFKISMENLAEILEPTFECQMDNGDYLYTEEDRDAFYDNAQIVIKAIQDNYSKLRKEIK